MDDQDIQVFITGVRRYFESLKADSGVVIEPPFIKDQERPLLEYTGVIEISGKARGAVCFTANGLMLKNILGFLNESRDPMRCYAILSARLRTRSVEMHERNLEGIF
jgi:chemotaxis protein CheX